MIAPRVDPTLHPQSTLELGTADLPRYMPALDGVRGVAILLVLMTNLYAGPAQHFFQAGVYQLFASGWVGVNLFFVLSGFLITGILYDSKGGPHYFRTFYARRFLRIFPLYYTALIVWVFVLPHFQWPGGDYAGALHQHQWWYWSYLANVRIAFAPWPMDGEPTHFWSLAVEEQFYLVWPLVIATAERRRLMAVCLGLMVISLAAHTGLRLVNSGLTMQHALHFLTPARLDDLALGGLLALGLRGPSGLAAARRWSRPAALVGSAALAGLFFWHRGLNPYGFTEQTIGRTLLACSAGALLMLAITEPRGTVPHALLTHPLLRALGRYSYGIYVWHELLVPLRQRGAENAAVILRASVVAAVVSWFVLSCCAIGLGALSWHALEKHFLRLKLWFPYGHPGCPVAAN